jgi:hypothetical protein
VTLETFGKKNGACCAWCGKAARLVFAEWDAAIHFINKAGLLFAPFGVLVAASTNPEADESTCSIASTTAQIEMVSPLRGESSVKRATQ